MRPPMWIDPEAERLLEENGWRWDGYYFAFRRIRRNGQSTKEYHEGPPELITYEEIADQGLTVREADERERARGLAWLKSRANGDANR
jgi:hypothetical protein